MRKGFIALLGLIWIVGCSTTPLQRFSKIKQGMYKGDVLDMVGSPTESRYRGDQYIWTYKFLDETSVVVKEVHVKDEFVTYVGEPQPMVWSSNIVRVSTGMSKSQVLDIMGFPKRTNKREGRDSWVYNSKVGGEAQVQFQDDKVVFVGPADPLPPTTEASDQQAGFETVE